MPSLHEDRYAPKLSRRLLAWIGIAALHVAACAWFLLQPDAKPVSSTEHTMMVRLVTARPTSAPTEPVMPSQPTPPAPTKPAPKLLATPNQTTASTLSAPVEEASETPPPQSSLPTTEQAIAALPQAAASTQESITLPDFTAAYLNNPGPTYPVASRRRREEGDVLLKVRVSATGAPEEVLVDTSSGFLELDQAAANIVKQRWRFVPAKQGDVAVAAWVTVPMSFTLKKR